MDKGNKTELMPAISKELIKSPALSMLEGAINSGMEPEKLLQFYELHERHEANEARKLYAIAMAKFQAGCPVIEKTSKGHNCWYAPLPKILKATQSLRAECGLAQNWVHGKEGEDISITCVVTHSAGHKESTTLSAPPDTSGNKNTIQSLASTTKYLERYTFEAMFGICADDADNDGNKQKTEYVNSKEIAAITERIKTLNINAGKFNKYFNIDKLDSLQTNQLKAVYDFFKEKEKFNATKAGNENI